MALDENLKNTLVNILFEGAKEGLASKDELFAICTECKLEVEDYEYIISEHWADTYPPEDYVSEYLTPEE